MGATDFDAKNSEKNDNVASNPSRNETRVRVRVRIGVRGDRPVAHMYQIVRVCCIGGLGESLVKVKNN